MVRILPRKIWSRWWEVYRYPGIISWKTPAGGGTTDYAVEIFYKAVEDGKYTSFISENSALPMLYIEDAINATIQLMDAPKEQITVRSSYNLGGLSFTPKQLSDEIKRLSLFWNNLRAWFSTSYCRLLACIYWWFYRQKRLGSNLWIRYRGNVWGYDKKSPNKISKIV